MLNRDALNNEWIEAAKAYRENERCQRLIESIETNGECKHPNARRKKDGTRDKRFSCSECQSIGYKALDRANSLYYDWGQVWDLFERIGMSVKESD